MKINKRNPWHWVYLALFTVNVLAARIGRRFIPRTQRGVVILYGHKLGGNLLAIYRQALLTSGHGLKLTFLTLDPAYHKELVKQGINCCLAISPSCLKLLLNARAIVTDHGLHAMEYLLGSPDLKFFDVWHGIPFKGFDAEDFRVQHRYDETWVASPMLAELYVNKFGFDPARVRVTGYARTDQLVRRDVDCARLRRQFGLPAAGQIVLFAPTWAQDAEGRSIYPFGMSEEEFLGQLSVTMDRVSATLVLRTHLNTAESEPQIFPAIMRLPFAQHPDTEALLSISDVLICDWSSIAFDFLVMDRPAIFLNVPPPFRKGFSLSGELRFGPIVNDIAELQAQILSALQATSRDTSYSVLRAETKAHVYGEFADGLSAYRCLKALQTRMENSEI